MKLEIEVKEDGLMYLSVEGNLILVTSYMSRLQDIVEDVIVHKGHSPLLEPRKNDALGKLFDL